MSLVNLRVHSSEINRGISLQPQVFLQSNHGCPEDHGSIPYRLIDLAKGFQKGQPVDYRH